jgi:AraC-like DNA-binding protein
LSFANTAINHRSLAPEEFYAVPLSKRRLEVRASKIGDIREEEPEGEDPTAELLALFRDAVRKGDYEDIEDRWLRLSPDLMRRVLSNEEGKDNSFLRAQYSFVRFITLLETEARDSGAGDTSVRNLTWKYTRLAEETIVRKQLESLYRQALLSYSDAVSARSKDNPEKNSMIAKVMEVVDRHITEPISTAEIADELGFSSSYLSSAFHRSTGMTVSSFIQKEKIRVASQLLRETDESLGEISAYLGYSSQSHFQNVFKKQMGVTPLAYRKKLPDKTQE